MQEPTAALLQRSAPRVPASDGGPEGEHAGVRRPAPACYAVHDPSLRRFWSRLPVPFAARHEPSLRRLRSRFWFLAGSTGTIVAAPRHEPSLRRFWSRLRCLVPAGVGVSVSCDAFWKH